MLPKVLIFTVTYEGKEYAYKDFVGYAEKINYPNCHHLWIDNSLTNDYSELLKSRGHDVIKCSRGNNTREALARSQETARKYALENGYEYMLSLESDIYVTPTIVQDLLGHAKEMVGALYFIGEDNLRLPCVTIIKKHKNLNLVGTRLLAFDELKEYINDGLKVVNSCGLGCTLIHESIFKDIGFMYLPELKGHSDVWFANEVWKNKHRIFVDTNIILEHNNISWSTIKDR